MPQQMRRNLQRNRLWAGWIATAALLLLTGQPARAQEPPPASTLTAPPAADPPATVPTSLPPQAQAQSAPPPTPQPPPAPVDAPGEPTQSNVHGIGLTLSFSTGAGFGYRRQWGPTSVQLSAFGVVTERGDSTVLSGGALVAHRLHVWHGASRSILPATSALRVLGGLSYFMNRSVSTQFVPNGIALEGVPCTTIGGCSATVTSTSSYVNGGVGMGFEFGAIDRPGVSMTLDVVLTAALKDGTFDFLLPLPQLAVLYNW